MLRPGMLLALPLTGTFVDTLLRTDFAIRRYPSYAGAWPFPRPDFHRLEDACLAGHAIQKKPHGCINSSCGLRSGFQCEQTAGQYRQSLIQFLHTGAVHASPKIQ